MTCSYFSSLLTTARLPSGRGAALLLDLSLLPLTEGINHYLLGPTESARY